MERPINASLLTLLCLYNKKMATIKKRALTEWEKAAASRLKAAWEEFQKTEAIGASQTWLGREAKIGNQSTVSQYLNGTIQLNTEALLAICKVIGVDPRQISSELTKDLPSNKSLNPEFILDDTAAEISEIIALYVKAEKEDREYILETLRSSRSRNANPGRRKR